MIDFNVLGLKLVFIANFILFYLRRFMEIVGRDWGF